VYKKNSGQQNNMSYASPLSSGLSSPSSGTWSASPFDSAKTNQTNGPVSLQTMNSVNRSRGDDWLQTTTSQTKFWQQYRGVSPPANNDQQPSTLPPQTKQVDNGQHQAPQPPSFPPPPLPPGVSTVNVKVINNSQATMSNQVPSMVEKPQQDGAKSWTTFDDKWNAIETPAVQSSQDSTTSYPSTFVSPNSFSPTNPFSQESSAVKI